MLGQFSSLVIKLMTNLWDIPTTLNHFIVMRIPLTKDVIILYNIFKNTHVCLCYGHIIYNTLKKEKYFFLKCTI